MQLFAWQRMIINLDYMIMCQQLARNSCLDTQNMKDLFSKSDHKQDDVHVYTLS